MPRFTVRDMSEVEATGACEGVGDGTYETGIYDEEQPEREQLILVVMTYPGNELGQHVADLLNKAAS